MEKASFLTAAPGLIVAASAEASCHGQPRYARPMVGKTGHYFCYTFSGGCGMMRVLTIIMAAVTVLLAVPPDAASADTTTVGHGPGYDFNAIQAAIDAAKVWKKCISLEGAHAGYMPVLCK